MFAGTTSKTFVPSYFWLVLMTLILAVLTDIYLVNNGISYREVIVGLALLGGLCVLLAGQAGLNMGLVFLVATFGLGYRTMSLTDNLRLHPSELVIVALFGLLIVRQATGRRDNVRFWLPTWFALLLPFCLWGWRTVGSGEVKLESMFLEFKNVILFVPLLVVMSNVIGQSSSWRSVFLTYYLVAVWIAGMGLLEYMYPQIKTFFPGFVSDPVAYQTGEGFQRAAFSFWGTSDAVYICVLALPLGMAVWDWWSASWTRVLTVLMTGIILGGIYISGHRNSWLIITVQFFSLLLAKKKYLFGGAVLLALLFAYQFLPISAKDRVYSAVELVTGQPLKYDTSGQKRWNRASTSLNNSLAEPLGRGWAAAGWVHNDFLQVSENLGLAAGALFLGAFIFTLQKLWRRVCSTSLKESRVSGIGLLLSFISAGMILASEAALVLPQLILPVWFIWAGVEVWLRQTSVSKVTKDDTLGAFANL